MCASVLTVLDPFLIFAYLWLALQGASINGAFLRLLHTQQVLSKCLSQESTNEGKNGSNPEWVTFLKI